METIEIKKSEKQPQILKDGLIKGSWKLTYALINPNGVKAFSGRTIGPYPDPVTGKLRVLFNANNEAQHGFTISKQIEYFNPEVNPEHKNIIDWLVGHPEVGVERSHTKMESDYYKVKKKNPRIKLINVDFEDLSDIENEEYIDKLVGVISQDSGKDAFSLEKMRFVLAKLDLPYFETKYVTNPKVESKHLRKKLKSYIRSSMDNAKKVEVILDNMEDAKHTLQIKEMIRKEIIVNNGGTYQYQNHPIGISMESIKKRFTNDPDFHAKLLEELYGNK